MAQDTAKALYVALWDYEAIEEDELSLKKGDMICASVDYLENSFGEWMVGENFRGKQGKFPATYVKAVQPGSSAQSAPLAMNATFEADTAQSTRSSFSSTGDSVLEGYDDEASENDGNAVPTVLSKEEKALRKFLKENSAHHYYDSLHELGVERIRDLNLVLPSDLRHIGMDDATIQRVLSLRSAGGTTSAAGKDSMQANTSTSHDVDGVTNSHRQRSIARAIVDALSPVELVKLKEYIFTPDSFDGGARSPRSRGRRQPSNNRSTDANNILTLEQQNILLEYTAAQFEALAQYRHMEDLFFQLCVEDQKYETLDAAENDLGEENDGETAKYPSCQKLRDGLLQLIAAQEVLCSFLRKHGLGTSCGGFIHDHIQRTAILFKTYSKLYPKANHELSHFIANVGHESKGEELLKTVVPLKSCLQLLRRALSFPLRRVKEDSQILARMSALLPEVHTLALVFRDIAALYNAGEDDRRYLLNLRTVLPKVLKLVHHPDPRGSEGENSTSGGGGGGSSRNSSSSKKKKVAAPIWVKKNCFQNYKVAVAAVLHDEWRKPRLLPDGTYDPRPKEVNGVIYDIANLPFRDLPPKFQLENMLASDNACCFVLMSTWENRGWNREQLEEGAMYQHDAWMQRNGSWAPPEQMLLYEDLTEEEKEKDRAIVVVAVEYLRRHFNNKIWASDRAPPRI